MSAKWEQFLAREIQTPTGFKAMRDCTEADLKWNSARGSLQRAVDAMHQEGAATYGELSEETIKKLKEES